MISTLSLVTEKPKTVFVLGGGGNLGAVQVGMLRGILERGIVPDEVVGCSVGAVNGAGVVADPTASGMDALARLWHKMRGETLCPSGLLGGLVLLGRRGLSLHGNEGLRAMLAANIAFERFEEATIPLHVVATDLATGAERWFSQGAVIDPILASCALPAVLPPVEIEGRLYTDGAVVNNVPISRAIALRARRIVILHVGNFRRERPAPRRPIEALVQAMSIARNARYAIERDAVPPEVEVIVPPSIDPGRLRYNDFTRSAELIERAHASTIAYLDGLEATAAATA
jgi:NTE family protein